MCSYNAINGIPSCANEYLLKEILRNVWKFDGYITSDSGAIEDIWINHNYTSTLPLAVGVAINATCDLDSYLGSNFGMNADYATGSPYQEYIVGLVNNGTVLQETVDKTLYRLFKIRFQLGLFEQNITQQKYWQIPPNIVNNDESKALNKFAARQSMILLKNGDSVDDLSDDILPWDMNQILSENTTIAVIGPHFNASQNLLYSGYTPPVCKDNTFDCVNGILTVLDEYIAIGDIDHDTMNVLYAQGCSDGVPCTNKSGFNDALSIANKSQYIVLMFGIDTINIEGEDRDRVNISLPGYQYELASNICNMNHDNKKIVLVLLNGGMIGIDNLALECDAIIEAHYPGFYGAYAIWDTIFGYNNPSGKLVMTMYYSNFTQISSMIEMNMNVSPGKTYKYFEDNVIFPFGYGLSYTRFIFSMNNSSTMNVDPLQQWNFKLNITNIGPVSGCETIMMMIKALDIDQNQAASSIKRKLVGFEKVRLDSKESRLIVMTLVKTDLLLVSNNGTKVLFGGRYLIQFTNGVKQNLNYQITI